MKYCYKCGNQLDDEAVICPQCGCAQPGTKPQTEKTFTVDLNGVAIGEGVILNTDFSSLDLYYQDRFQRILGSNEQDKGGWNWFAFLFGAFWALYKGCWLSALVLLAISILTGGILWLPAWIFYGIRGNYMYYCKFVKNQQRII